MRENREHSSASKETKMEDQEEAGAEIDSLFCDEIDLYFNQEMTNKEVEAKDEVQEARSGTYKSDGDSSWEEVQNSVDGKLNAEIAAPDQKKTDELEEL
ncbi:Csm4 family CRISPR-associated RAMP protein [Corchorus olitorius]|uniref:Csm4 family CRISPR-associated RAMP protein n=1 Tax=Corchorus olitorius TaxID=93759 RepID=A0A1R3JD45_9ROSI|nr:Csm4 family CRISPR-associated RAMP protein [Corchorus olitorius]